jgi:hypothetical protein
MAKATYPCPKCGTTITIGGKSYNRQRADRYAAYLQERGDICDQCQRDEWQRENEKAVASSTAAGLPTLSGSEKQIAWASKIRLQMLPEIEKAVAKIDAIRPYEDPLTDAAYAEIADAIALIASEMRSETDARWWIDNRNAAARYLIEQQWAKRAQYLAPTAWAEARAKGLV